MAYNPTSPASWDVNHDQALPDYEVKDLIKAEALLCVVQHMFKATKSMRKRFVALKSQIRSLKRK
jgi:hypothetical protein